MKIHFFAAVGIAISHALYPQAHLITSAQDIITILQTDPTVLGDSDTLQAIDYYLKSEALSEPDRITLKNMLVDLFLTHVTIKSFVQQAADFTLYRDWMRQTVKEPSAPSPLVIFTGIFGIFGGLCAFKSLRGLLRYGSTENKILVVSWITLCCNSLFIFGNMLIDSFEEEPKLVHFENTLNLLAARVLQQNQSLSHAEIAPNDASVTPSGHPVA